MCKLPIEKLFKDHVLTIGDAEYKLRKVSKEELLSLRIEGKPGVVFKEKSEIWYASLPSEKVKLSGLKWLEHSCSSERECCTHLSALPDSEGGCKAIRDPSLQSIKTSDNIRRKACLISFRIEKYDFLEYALETFGMLENGFKALKCINMRYEDFKPMQINVALQKKKLLGLAQYLNPEITSFSEIDESF